MNSKSLAVGAALIVAAIALWFTVGSKQFKDEPTAVASDAAPPTILIVTPESGSTFDEPTATVNGTATPGSIVQISGIGTVSPDASGAWATSVPLQPGHQTLSFSATKDNVLSEPEFLTLTRRVTRDERDAVAKGRAAMRAAMKQESAYTRKARAIPFAELSADPDKFTDRRVFIRGNVFQIREDDQHSYLLVEVLESDSEQSKGVAWINYGEAVSVELQRTVHIWGDVVGVRQYESTRSEQEFVPEINAKYIQEAP